MKYTKVIFILLICCVLFSSCGQSSNSIKVVQNANNSSGTYWDYSLDKTTVLQEVSYEESKFPFNFGPGYRQVWTFEIIGEGEVTVQWLAYEGDTYSESHSYEVTYTVGSDGSISTTK